MPLPSVWGRAEGQRGRGVRRCLIDTGPSCHPERASSTSESKGLHTLRRELLGKHHASAPVEILRLRDPSGRSAQDDSHGGFARGSRVTRNDLLCRREARTTTLGLARSTHRRQQFTAVAKGVVAREGAGLRLSAGGGESPRPSAASNFQLSTLCLMVLTSPRAPSATVQRWIVGRWR